ncbi:hypothetical protein GHT09_011774 [Marmota monax]|uniref:Uncharacterized protein n=1 Tax=Marmota monax TaxID=9995 RepID=A0A834QCX8_MARMO|nr:hypothetical protein GHT09_011774 [Marmota monax]
MGIVWGWGTCTHRGHLADGKLLAGARKRFLSGLKGGGSKKARGEIIKRVILAHPAPLPAARRRTGAHPPAGSVATKAAPSKAQLPRLSGSLHRPACPSRSSPERSHSWSPPLASVPDGCGAFRGLILALPAGADSAPPPRLLPELCEPRRSQRASGQPRAAGWEERLENDGHHIRWTADLLNNFHLLTTLGNCAWS